MYSLDTKGRHMDPGTTEEEDECENLIDGLIIKIKEVKPAKAAPLALLKIGPTERTQGWFPNNFEHGMRLLGEPLKHVRTFQAHVLMLATEAGMWAARCRVVHPVGTVGMPSYKKVSDEYTGELGRSERKMMPITRRAYMGLPASKRKSLLTQWKIAFPARKKKFMDDWVQRVEGPARLSRVERLAIKTTAEAARRKSQPR